MVIGQQESILIGMGEMVVTNDTSTVLTCVGLGSCVALCAYDPVSKIGGVAHLVLPIYGSDNGKEPSAKWVDTGVPLLLRKALEQGAVKSRLVIKMAGGARMLAIPGCNGRLDIGARNIAELKAAATREGITISAAEVGGNSGRTLHLFMDSGKVTVKAAGGTSKEL